MSLGSKLIESVEFKIGGVVIQKLDGDGNAIIKHVGGTTDDCPFCKYKKTQMSGADFQYYYGTLHKREKKAGVVT